MKHYTYLHFLILIKKKATIISRKKDQYVENLKDLRAAHANLEKQLKEKGKGFGEDGEMMKPEEVSLI